MYRDAVLRRINDERARQQANYGDDRNLDDTFWNIILVEEVGEVSKAILESDPGLEDELIQVAAVAVAWLEDRMIQKEKKKHAL